MKYWWRKRRQIAKVIDWAPLWDTGAPRPLVIAENEVYLTYRIDETSYARVTFFGARAHRFGMYNDEVGAWHPLKNRGLQYYAAHVVENSTWIAELWNVHKYHRHANFESWKHLKHYLLFFHDEMFEIIADAYDIEVMQGDYSALISFVISYKGCTPSP